MACIIEKHIHLTTKSRIYNRKGFVKSQKATRKSIFCYHINLLSNNFTLHLLFIYIEVCSICKGHGFGRNVVYLTHSLMIITTIKKQSWTLRKSNYDSHGNTNTTTCHEKSNALLKKTWCHLHSPIKIKVALISCIPLKILWVIYLLWNLKLWPLKQDGHYFKKYGRVQNVFF